MSDADQVVARHDAVERLTYASLSKDRHGIAAAYAALREAVDLDSAEATDDARAAVTDNDPFTAAALGWLTTPQLRARVSQDPRRYLTEDEQDAYTTQGDVVLSMMVSARLDGVSLGEVQARGHGRRRSDYDLAARGRVRDTRKLQQLLREQGLLDDDEQ